MRLSRLGGVVVFGLPLGLGSSGCTRDEAPPTTTFYERRIAPILQQSCVDSPAKSGCHVRADSRGNALGNLSLQSYADLENRRDLIANYGPYGMPGLLLKVAPKFKLALTSWKRPEPLVIDTNIAHVGGSLLDITSTSFAQLQTWMANGAAENNAHQADRRYEQTPCSTVVGSDPEFDPTIEPAAADFRNFEKNVNGVLAGSCAAGNCHGSANNSLHLTCGTTTEQLRWNYFAAGDYVSSEPESSEIVRRPLAPSAGGTFHEGGAVFADAGDAGYEALLAWATEKGGPSHDGTDPNFIFFADRVQPMLVRRGCMMLGCHSAAMFHDYRLRGGSGGHFGLPATRKNYELTLEQLALDSPDPESSRLFRKNLIPAPAGRGMLHRGGPLFAEHPATCDMAAAESGPLDAQSEYCVMAAWFAKERAARGFDRQGLTAIAFVRRPPAPKPDTPQDYAAFAPGAEVVSVAVTRDPVSGDLALGAETSLSRACGLDPRSSDARRPAVSWDGSKIAFAARAAASAPFEIYVVEGDACAKDPVIARPAVDDDGAAVPDNGELVHDFDPQFAPDGRIVFASTRGNSKNTRVFRESGYEGPQRTPADPSRLNANLYVREGDRVRQLTFLLNHELSPAFMRDGRVILIAEKRQPDFYQLAGRRINLDGGDYHPLFGQRRTIGFNQFTDVVELADKNFAAILSEKGAAHGAGTLAIVNRSIGIDQRSEDPADYVQSAAAIGWPDYRFYQRSIRILDEAASGKLASTQGAYRNPSPLPDGRLLVSYAANVTSLGDFDGNFDIVVVDDETGARTPLVTGPEDELWPVAVYARYSPRIFSSRLDEPNGSTQVLTDGDDASFANVTILDTKILGSLIFQNTRTGRIFPQGLRGVWESLPPVGAKSFAEVEPEFLTSDAYGPVYVRRRLLGVPEIFADDSAAMRFGGGLPILLEFATALEGEREPQLHLQREEMQFYPGEVARQGFRREFFDNMCGGCHGSRSGFENEIAVNPDILTQASNVAAIEARPSELSARGRDVGP